MATRFEIVLHGENPTALRAAGEEALAEIERLDGQLSLYRPTSEIARVNARAAGHPVRVTPELFALLKWARQLHQESGGAFDITIAPLLRCWGFMGGQGHFPNEEELAEARANTGMHLVNLDEKEFTVSFSRPGVMLDLGSIGKGYAIERAAELLREAGVSSALIHGGTSTVYALGSPLGQGCWKVAIEKPSVTSDGCQVTRGTAADASRHASDVTRHTSTAEGEINVGPPLAVVPLKDEAMSVSAVWGKCFRTEDRILGHVLDPRKGEPVSGALLAAVVLPSATETDALSTALLVLGSSAHEKISNLRPPMRSLVIVETNGGLSVESNGLEIKTKYNA